MLKCYHLFVTFSTNLYIYNSFFHLSCCTTAPYISGFSMPDGGYLNTRVLYFLLFYWESSALSWSLHHSHIPDCWSWWTWDHRYVLYKWENHDWFSASCTFMYLSICSINILGFYSTLNIPETENISTNKKTEISTSLELIFLC